MSGEIEIEVMPEWAPHAASRFRELARVGLLTTTRASSAFFQGSTLLHFGIAADPGLNKRVALFANLAARHCPMNHGKTSQQKGDTDLCRIVGEEESTDSSFHQPEQQ
jgi:hypothetical protein